MKLTYRVKFRTTYFAPEQVEKIVSTDNIETAIRKIRANLEKPIAARMSAPPRTRDRAARYVTLVSVEYLGAAVTF